MVIEIQSSTRSSHSNHDVMPSKTGGTFGVILTPTLGQDVSCAARAWSHHRSCSVQRSKPLSGILKPALAENPNYGSLAWSHRNVGAQAPLPQLRVSSPGTFHLYWPLNRSQLQVPCDSGLTYSNLFCCD